MKHVTPAEVAARLAEDPSDLTLLDCRELAELVICSLPSALHIPMQEIPGRWSELDQDGELVVFCHSGIRSQHVVHFLEQQGFTNAANMVGGIDAWSVQVDSEVPRY